MLPLYNKANDQTFIQMQTAWKSQLDPVLANPLVDGILLKNVALDNGETQINHLLGRKPLGWFLVDQNAAASIYRAQPMTILTLTLFSDSAVTVSLWVF